MRFNFGYSVLVSLILSYPILLAGIFFFDYEPFVITAPYFALLLLLLGLQIVVYRKLRVHKDHLINILLLGIVAILVCFNFSSIRYSLPILFCLFMIALYVVLAIQTKNKSRLDSKVFYRFLIIYLVLSFGFLALEHTHMLIGDRYIGFTGSPTTFAGILVTAYILWDRTQESAGLVRLIMYGLVFFLVVLSKTRLVIIFFVLYPLLIFIIKKKALKYSSLFLTFFGVLFFLYPLYDIVVKQFPQLITMRYEDARDASFGLRYYLYQLVFNDFSEGNLIEMFFGSGNEASRLEVLSETEKDLFPHNDFIRVINDWGIMASILFFIFLYRISKKNLTALMIGILYLILFYSNMVFNLFMMSVLMISYFYGGNEKKLI